MSGAGAVPAAVAWRKAVSVVAKAEGLTRSEIVSPRGKKARGARALAGYLARVGYDVQARRLAAVAGLSHVAIIYASRSIEDRRDDAAYDRFVTRLEQEIAA